MVVMSLEKYSKLMSDLEYNEYIENALGEADKEAENPNTKYFTNVIIRKPKIEINNENYKYLQFIDLIENKDNIYVEVDNMDEIIYNFIEENELQFEKILKYARETNSKMVIEKIVALAR